MGSAVQHKTTFKQLVPSAVAGLLLACRRHSRSGPTAPSSRDLWQTTMTAFPLMSSDDAACRPRARFLSLHRKSTPMPSTPSPRHSILLISSQNTEHPATESLATDPIGCPVERRQGSPTAGQPRALGNYIRASATAGSD